MRGDTDEDSELQGKNGNHALCPVHDAPTNYLTTAVTSQHTRVGWLYIKIKCARNAELEQQERVGGGGGGNTDWNLGYEGRGPKEHADALAVYDAWYMNSPPRKLNAEA